MTPATLSEWILHTSKIDAESLETALQNELTDAEYKHFTCALSHVAFRTSYVERWVHSLSEDSIHVLHTHVLQRRASLGNCRGEIAYTKWSRNRQLLSILDAELRSIYGGYRWKLRT